MTDKPPAALQSRIEELEKLVDCLYTALQAEPATHIDFLVLRGRASARGLWLIKNDNTFYLAEPDQ